MTFLDELLLFTAGMLFGMTGMAVYIFTLLRLRMGRWWWER